MARVRPRARSRSSQRAGVPVRAARAGDLAGPCRAARGLSSSAALEVALTLALIALCGRSPSPTGSSWRSCARGSRTTGSARRPACSTRSRRCWARTTARCGSTSARSRCTPVPLELGDFRLVTLDSGEDTRTPARATTSAERECALASARARRAEPARRRRSMAAAELPSPLTAPRPARDHRERACRRGGALRSSGATWTSSGGCSTPRTRACATASRSRRRRSRTRSQRLHEAGALGARIIGGGFGGHVLGLMPPDARRRPRPLGGAARAGRAGDGFVWPADEASSS